MSYNQAKFLAESLAENSGGKAIFYGGSWSVEVWINEQIALSFRPGFGAASLGLHVDAHCPVNTCTAEMIRIAVSKIEHAEELCIAAGLGDPRSKP